MLILTRRVGETIFITVPPGMKEEVQIIMTVLGVKGNQVRLGTTAPKEFRVDREEIHERILREKAHAEHSTKGREGQVNHRD